MSDDQTRITIRNPAGEHERYAPRSGDGLVGRTVPVNADGVPLGTGQVVAVKVASDGSHMDITVSVDDITGRALLRMQGAPWPGPGGFSISA